MVYATFGSFGPLAALSYGMQQSFAWSSGVFACKYYMMNELGLDGPTMGRLLTASFMPWNIKPIIGLMSDTLALCGYHRTSYLVMSCILAILMYLWVGFAAVQVFGLMVFMTSISFAIAFSDVVIDGAGASLARIHPAAACDLQTLLRVSFSLGGMASSGIKGLLVKHLSPRGTLLSTVLCPIVVLIPTLRGWLPEDRRSGCCSLHLKGLSSNYNLTAGSFILAVEAVALSLSQTFLEDWQVRLATVLAFTVGILITTYITLKKLSWYLWTTGILLFLRDFFQPGLGESMFVWLSTDINGPQLDPEIMGWADCFGQAGLLLGVVLFNRYLRKWKFRNIFLLGQLLVLVAQLMDLVLVMRWNRAIGIPDVVFFLGDATFDQAIARTFWMPCAVLAYKVCPPLLEATLFATLMSLANLGIDTGKYMGVCLAEFWHLNENFEYLPHGVISKALFRLLPIPCILLLAPTFSPDDPVPGGDMAKDPQDKPAL